MDDGKNKIVVVAKEGEAKVKYGTMFHTLTGKAFKTYRTDNIDTFFDYLLEQNEEGELFFNSESIVAMRNVITFEDNLPIAICEFNESPYLRILREANNKGHSFEKMEDLLLKLREYSDYYGRQVFDFCRNAMVNKIVKMVRTKDNSGNFQFNYSTETGADDFKCPELVTFSVPIIEHINETWMLPFDMILNFKQGTESVIAELKIVDLNFDTKVKDFKKQIIEKKIGEFYSGQEATSHCGQWVSFWGSCEIVKLTDQWKYDHQQ